MKKKNVGIIGNGKWGKKIINELQKISNIKFVYNSKNNFKNYEKEIDWIFILTPDSTHYDITKFFLKKNVNVFCEKPLSIKIKEAQSLIELSRRIKSRLYVDDIENYKKKKIRINKDINYIIRTKRDKGSVKSLLNRLAYHDFYLLSEFLELNKIASVQVSNSKKFLQFKIILNNKKIFDFHYNISSKIKKHQINKISLDKFKNNPMRDMLISVLYKKKNFKRNNLDALKCIRLINKISKKIK